MTCPKCGASVRVVVERVMGFVTTRELCSAGHSRPLTIEGILTTEERPLPPPRKVRMPKRDDLQLRVCVCGQSFQPVRIDHVYHAPTCERRARNIRKRLQRLERYAGVIGSRPVSVR